MGMQFSQNGNTGGARLTRIFKSMCPAAQARIHHWGCWGCIPPPAKVQFFNMISYIGYAMALQSHLFVHF